MVSKAKKLSEQVKEIQDQFKVIGREQEIKLLLIAVKANKNIILEGLVGTGKTYLARAIAEYIDSKFIRIDGSEDVFAHTLTGYFDPPALLSKGYKEESFIYGPLSQALLQGACLFINELNRLPEQTQNVLLSALDEKNIIIPKLKTIEAADEFLVIATQNPEAHVGVSALGEALKDRFVWIDVKYQSEEEEIEIVKLKLNSGDIIDNAVEIIVKIVRETRNHSSIRRGASVRGAIDLAQLIHSMGKMPKRGLWYKSTDMALHTKIELMEGIDQNTYEILKDIVDKVLDHF